MGQYDTPLQRFLIEQVANGGFVVTTFSVGRGDIDHVIAAFSTLDELLAWLKTRVWRVPSED